MLAWLNVDQGQQRGDVNDPFRGEDMKPEPKTHSKIFTKDDCQSWPGSIVSVSSPVNQSHWAEDGQFPNRPLEHQVITGILDELLADWITCLSNPPQDAMPRLRDHMAGLPQRMINAENY